ncbi:MAG: PSD1 domain-containing protein [Bryobacterales bacterium]|nr:PSD1 domain-containing protein [Bryobacterales bacterium]
MAHAGWNAAAGLAWLLAAAGLSAQDAGMERFETTIRPVLERHCIACHQGERGQGGLRLDLRGGWETGGKHGPAVVPGRPDASLLLKAMRHEPGIAPMPLGAAKLPDETIAAFVQWIAAGAPDPRTAPRGANSHPERPWSEVFAERKQWWSLQPVRRPEPPPVRDTQWARQPLDRFILHRLESEGLRPAPPAARAVLFRRLHFVLTGLPPDPAEVDAFVNDPDPKAYERAVSRLLESPHFGERFARHWMDVVRYSDTYGYEWDIPAKGAWRYRDYLIRAFNRDTPFDQLVREQIAGDLLPSPRIDRDAGINESLIGPMFFQLGEKRHGDSLQFNGIHQEMLNNKVDAFSKAFLATTVACARCHDHKLDAVTQQDYYSLAGSFMSARWVSNTLDTPERGQAERARLVDLKQGVRDALTPLWRAAAHDFGRHLEAAQAALNGETVETGTLDAHQLAAWQEALCIDVAAVPIEDPLWPWFAVSHTPDLSRRWTETAQRIADTARERTAANRRNYQPFADLRTGQVPEGWSADGVGLRHGAARAGDIALATEGDEAVSVVLPAGLFTNTLSPRLNGALRTPDIDSLGKRWISLEVSGGDFAARRLVIDNAFLTERQGYLRDRKSHWVTLSAIGYEKGNRPRTQVERAETRIYAELATKTSNPNFPPRVGLGGKCTDEQAADPRSWFGIARAVLHDTEKPPADELARFSGLFDGPAPATRREAAARVGRWLQASVERWAAGSATAEDVWLLNWMLERRLLPNRADAAPLRDAVAAYRRAERDLPVPETVNGMRDTGPGADYRVNRRGVYEDLGDPVPRGVLSALDKGGAGNEPGSGRLALARSVAAPDNPLTARVFVNRLWHWVFGTGLVATPDDFGHLGERPSHPELLDFLADEFIQSGWSVKHTVRAFVLSQTFRQSGRPSVEAAQTDPRNRLWHHYPLRRLEAEAIRDSILAVSGRLDRRIYGPPVDPYRTSEDPEKRLFSGPLDGLGRRSLYVKMTIMEPPKFLAVFNQPSPKIPTGRRDLTNVPAQALALLNDPFVADQAEFWAKRLIEMPHRSPGERTAAMFRAALGRNPEAAELDRWSTSAFDLRRALRGRSRSHDLPSRLEGPRPRRVQPEGVPLCPLIEACPAAGGCPRPPTASGCSPSPRCAPPNSAPPTIRPRPRPSSSASWTAGRATSTPSTPSPS